jgi:MFS family permease
MESLPDVVGGKALCHHFGDASFAVGEIYAFVGQVYPAWSRATGLGWAAGVGRIGAIVGPIVIGALLAGDRGYPWGPSTPDLGRRSRQHTGPASSRTAW